MRASDNDERKCGITRRYAALPTRYIVLFQNRIRSPEGHSPIERSLLRNLIKLKKNDKKIVSTAKYRTGGNRRAIIIALFAILERNKSRLHSGAASNEGIYSVITFRE